MIRKSEIRKSDLTQNPAAPAAWAVCEAYQRELEQLKCELNSAQTLQEVQHYMALMDVKQRKLDECLREALQQELQ